jgi:hypothetical protein
MAVKINFLNGDFYIDRDFITVAEFWNWTVRENVRFCPVSETKLMNIDQVLSVEDYQE